MGLCGHTAVAIVRRNRDGARGGVHQAVLVVGKDVLDTAAQGRQFGGAERLQRGAVAPVDGVAEWIGRPGHVAAGDGQREGVAFVDAARSTDVQARRDIVHRDGLGAGIGMGAVFIHQGDRDSALSAAAATIGIHMFKAGIGEDICSREGFNGSVPPAHLVSTDLIDTGIGDCADIQGIDTGLAYFVGAAQRHRRRYVGHGDTAATGTQPRAIFVDQIDRDRRCRQAVGIGVGKLTGGRQIDGGDRLISAIAPMDHVTLNRIVARIVDCTERQYIGGTFRHAATADERYGRHHIADHDIKTVTALLSFIIDDDRDRVVGGVVRISVADDEAVLSTRQIARRRLPIAPVHRISAAQCALVRRIIKGNGFLEIVALLYANVRSGIDRDDLCGRGHRQRLAPRRRPGPILVAQRDRDGHAAGRSVGMGKDAVGRQGRGRIDLLHTAVTPVDPIFVHRVVARIVRGPEIDGVNLSLGRPVCTRYADGRRHICHGNLEGIRLDAVGVTGLVVYGHGDRIVAIIGKIVREVRIRRTGGEGSISGAITPIHRHQVTFRIRVANRDGMVEPLILGTGVVGTSLEAGTVIDVVEGDVAVGRRGSE